MSLDLDMVVESKPMVADKKTTAYDQAALSKLRKHYEGLRDRASYDEFLRAAHYLITKLGIEPYYIRMALTGKYSMLEFGSRAAFQHREVPEGIEVGLLIDREDVERITDLLSGEPHHFSPDPVDFVTLLVPAWKDIPSNVMALNEKAMAAEYKRQFGKKLVEQRRGSGTDNEAMRHAVVHNEQLMSMANGRRYWAAGFNIGAGRADLQPFIAGNYWDALKYAATDMSNQAKEARALFSQIQPGDYFLIKGLGGKHDLIVHYVGEVLQKDSTNNRLDLKPLDVEHYTGKAPTGSGAGNWHNTLLEVTRPQDITLLFKTTVGQTIEGVKRAVSMEIRQPQNVILFGPPGTGKTYGVFRHAVMLATDSEPKAMAQSYPTQKDVVAVFNKLLIKDWKSEVEQIAFVTFHQAFSYEDFVEGLKPRSEADGSVSYSVEPGIFKRIVARAMDNWLMSRQSSRTASFEEALEQLQDSWERDRDMKFTMRTKGYEFSVLGFTETSIRFKKASGGTGHTLSLATLRDLYYDQRELKDAGLDIYYPGVIEKLRSFSSSASQAGELKNYVLVIDEINRANLSAVLGELITLLESDKRRGADNHLEVILPYSKEPFSIPPNLHIIGTMNTADRSVEALDTALRRRFSFIECPSKPEELEKLAYRTVGEVDLSKLLAVINARIEMLLDRDHHIGHSYFMHWKEPDNKLKLRQVFKNNIIPLLQEYFYGDPVKVGMVLGGGFVEMIKKGDARVVAFAKDFKVDDVEAKMRYTFLDPITKREDGSYQVPWSAFEKLAAGE